MRRRHRFLACALALSFSFAAGSALADPPPLSASLTGEAKAAYEGGKLLYENKDFDGAETKFRAAYRESHDARLLWNIATCEKELRHYARTAELIERFVADAPSLVSPDFLTQAQATLAALREFYSPVHFNVEPAGTHVLLDDKDIGVAPLNGPVLVDLGKHRVRAEHDGFAPYDSSIDVAGQGAMNFDIALEARSNAAQLAVAPSDPADTVVVDDSVVGTGRWQGNLTPGGHRLKVTAPGKKAFTLDLELAQGEHRTVDVSLEDERRKPVWPWIAGGAGVVVAGGVIAGILLATKTSNSTSAPPPGPAAPTITLHSLARLGTVEW